MKCAVTVACHVIPASGRLVDVDVPELSESPWPCLLYTSDAADE